MGKARAGVCKQPDDQNRQRREQSSVVTLEYELSVFNFIIVSENYASVY